MHRRVISTGARMLARPLTTVSDPMSGFFGIHKKYVPFPSFPRVLRIVQPSLQSQSSWFQNRSGPPFEIASSRSRCDRSPLLVWNTQGRRIQTHRESNVEISRTVGRVVLVGVLWVDHCDDNGVCDRFCTCGSTDRDQLGQI